MTKSKKLSSPFATGGGGFHFEAHVQASFVTLMLTGGCVPCLPCWPIVEIQLQGKILGFDTDDLIVFVEDPITKERRKLLGQIKHSIDITKNSSEFESVIQAAWNDFNNSENFIPGTDVIALITGPLNKIDIRNTLWLLNQAKRTKNSNEFFRNVGQANFSPPQSSEKLKIIKHHLKKANCGKAIPNIKIYDFLKNFYLLSYDLGNEFGVALSLLHSHISQFTKEDSVRIWSQIVDFVQTWNQDAGTITLDDLKKVIGYDFHQKSATEMPENLKSYDLNNTIDWKNHKYAIHLALLVLIGSWKNENQYDQEIISHLLGISYDDWLKESKNILHLPKSPLSLKNGVWSIANRIDFLNLLGSYIFIEDIKKFKTLAFSVLKEDNTVFNTFATKQYTADIYRKVFTYSQNLRRGIAEGLAILGNHPTFSDYCSDIEIKNVCVSVLHELLLDADRDLWSNLNSLLPILAEVSPQEYIKIVDNTLNKSPCPFEEIFIQEQNRVTRGNYLTGLFWSLEVLAWKEEYFIDACLALANLASRDPSGSWSSHPSKSLSTILLPWLPQTLASVDRQQTAVQAILTQYPGVAWDLSIRLLSGEIQTSLGTYKPRWYLIIPDNWKTEVTHEQYWQQISFYAKLAIGIADQDPERISRLIDYFNRLPDSEAQQLLQKITSQQIKMLPEKQRILIWTHLTKFINMQRRFYNELETRIENLLVSIEEAAQQIIPSKPINMYQFLFNEHNIYLYKKNEEWIKQGKELNDQRDKAITEIFYHDNLDGVIKFAEYVSFPYTVGSSLGIINDYTIDLKLLPDFLNSSNDKYKKLVYGFISRRYNTKGWEWCDSVDKSKWTSEQIGQFLIHLPFIKETWNRASQWLKVNEDQYWFYVTPYPDDYNFSFAVEKLITYGRPKAAIYYLSMIHDKQIIDLNIYTQTLYKASTSYEQNSKVYEHSIINIIKFLQKNPLMSKDDLFKIEWLYLSLLNYYDVDPISIHVKLSTNPEFFCDVIQATYRSQNEDYTQRKYNKESKKIAENTYKLLKNWKLIPGIQQDGTFNKYNFDEWIQKVKNICTKSGHLDIALVCIGEVLTYAPNDSNGLWIHYDIASELNKQENDRMREGYEIKIYNNIGFYKFNPTEKQKNDLAKKFNIKASALENKGFYQFAKTFKNLAARYT